MDGPPIIFYLSFFIKIIYVPIVALNFKYFINSSYNIYLILGLIYTFLSLFYLMSKKCFGGKGDLCCVICFYFIDSFIYFILLIITIIKLINDNKDKSKEQYKIVIMLDLLMLILIILILILQFIHYYFFCQKKNLEKFNEEAIVKQTKIITKEVVKIKKFKGFKINNFVFSKAFLFKPLNYSTIQYLLQKYLLYTISSEQNNIINIINNLREKKNISKLKYNNTEMLNDYFEKIDHFFSIGNIFQFNHHKAYLFIYPIGEFKNKLLNNNEIIIKILMKGYLNNIIILQKENNEYILIFEENKNKIY